MRRKSFRHDQPTLRENMDDVERITPQLAQIDDEPYYHPVGNELPLFEAAWRNRLPVLLKGPTGCGKSRFVEHMA